MIKKIFDFSSRMAVVSLVFLTLSGCDGPVINSMGVSDNASVGVTKNASLARFESTNAASAPGESGKSGATVKLAYSHTIDLATPSATLKTHYEMARDLCLNNAQLGCMVMNASLNTGMENDYARFPFANLTIRLPHASVTPFMASLLSPLPGQAKGDVILRSQATDAEDLTRSITDIERRQAQLEDYRDRLTELGKRTDAKVEDLVKIEGELSNVQSQLEAIAGEKKGLYERVDTEKVTVSFRSEGAENPAAPIANAWHHGGKLLGESTAKAISFCIGALPWLPVIAVALFLIRLFLFRRRKT